MENERSAKDDSTYIVKHGNEIDETFFFTVYIIDLLF